MAKVRNKLLGLTQVFNNLNKEISKLKGRTQGGVTAAALFIKGEAMEETPVVEGNLRGSAFVTWPGGSNAIGKFEGDKVAVLNSNHAQEVGKSSARVKSTADPVAEVGFSAEYAIKVHENPNAGKTKGANAPSAGSTTGGAASKRKTFATSGKWKFLEDPLKRNAVRVLEIIKQKARI